MISLDSTKCIGCCSCSNVCPSKNITREDVGARRIIRYKACQEFCDICVESCPGKALKLAAQGEDVEIAFDMVRCEVCGAPYATEKMLDRIRTSIPADQQVDSTGKSWVGICPMCRRDLERERAARPIIASRGR
ncbi:MAG TPA: 4Fe-4S binding protein [Methanotrichaceae archaeon]|nr:4Fe-4S binding protein [Methanotrichaceae archaeon]